MVKIQFHHRPDDVSLPSLQLMRGDPPADSPPLPARSISNQREKRETNISNDLLVSLEQRDLSTLNENHPIKVGLENIMRLKISNIDRPRISVVQISLSPRFNLQYFQFQMSPPSTNYVKERVGNLAVFGGLLSFKKINTRNVTSYRDFLSTFV